MLLVVEVVRLQGGGPLLLFGGSSRVQPLRYWALTPVQVVVCDSCGVEAMETLIALVQRGTRWSYDLHVGPIGQCRACSARIGS